MPTKKQPEPLTESDFVKGLMLVGLITPITPEEIEEKERLQEFEQAQLNKQKATATPKRKAKSENIYFRRAVLAAEIVSSLHDEPTFGRVKFQKIVYMCEYVSSLDVQGRYLKQIAGPFDNKFMHSIIKEFERQNWFTEEHINQRGIKRALYKPLEGCDKYKGYYASFFKESNEAIQKIIDLFRQQKTDYTEVSATLIACYLELKKSSGTILEDELLEKFYTWSEKKGRFEKSYVLKNWTWLQENGLVPAL